MIPGTVAYIDVDGQSSYLGMWSADQVWVTAAGAGPTGHRRVHATDRVTNVRVQAVIDPTNRGHVAQLTPLRLRESLEAMLRVSIDDRAWERIRGYYAADLAAFVAPRPDEPGTWGVVEASCVHSDVRRNWMRHKDDNWYVIGTDTKNNPDDWDSLVDPIVVRDGVLS